MDGGYKTTVFVDFIEEEREDVMPVYQLRYSKQTSEGRKGAKDNFVASNDHEAKTIAKKRAKHYSSECAARNFSLSHIRAVRVTWGLRKKK